MSSTTPTFESLPLQKDGPRGNAWGLFGAKDELCMLNCLTQENTLAATKEIQHGIRVCTDWSLDQPKAPCFNRKPFEHNIHSKNPRSVNDDILFFNTQSSTQWDGFRHFGYQDRKMYFNGCTQEHINTSHRIGTHVWVENGGIVGRGILLDYANWAVSQGFKPDPLTTHKILLSDLNKVAESQSVTFRPNDILFIRSGYINAVSSLSKENAIIYTSKTAEMPAIGVESGEEILKWIWDNQFAAVAGDIVTGLLPVT